MRIKNYILPLLFAAIATALSVVVTNEVSHRAVQQSVSRVVKVEKPRFEISPYDEIFQEVGEEYNVDWLLLTAIAHAESEFRFDAISKAGAVGLMQIMPFVARNMGYEREQLFDAQISTEIAAQLLHENNKMLRLSSDFDKGERLNFILACYNAGYSRIADARRLARYHREDANTWVTVQKYLSLMSEEEYYEHELVRSGEFDGSEETIAYVSKVMRIYNVYKTRFSQFERQEETI